MLRKILFLVGLMGWGLGAFAERPNIVWIFSDDHSYQTVGAYGGSLVSLNPSPNICHASPLTYAV